jgi:hypothetical protein
MCGVCAYMKVCVARTHVWIDARLLGSVLSVGSVSVNYVRLSVVLWKAPVPACCTGSGIFSREDITKTAHSST